MFSRKCNYRVPYLYNIRSSGRARTYRGKEVYYRISYKPVLGCYIEYE